MAAIMDEGIAATVAKAVPSLLGVSAHRYWVDYDEDADVLYIGLSHPQRATNTTMTDDGMLLRYRGRELVGITVLNASTRT